MTDMEKLQPTRFVKPFGLVEWILPNGLYHREDGPAKIYTNGSKSWWRNGKLHREEGPAVIYPDGTEQWWLNGEKIR